MDQSELESLISQLENVQREDTYGYAMFFVGDDHLLPFVSIIDSDNQYDNVSHLDRDGVFRINIGLTRKTFTALVGDIDPDAVDHTSLDTFLPHPHYANQQFVCILSPSDKNAGSTRQLILEAHALAASRLERRSRK
jgi:hypothetical protein